MAIEAYQQSRKRHDDGDVGMKTYQNFVLRYESDNDDASASVECFEKRRKEHMSKTMRVEKSKSKYDSDLSDDCHWRARENNCNDWKYMKLPGAKKKRRELFLEYLKRLGVLRRINQRRRERYELEPEYNKEMRGWARRYQKQKFRERENRRVLENLKEYTAGQNGFSTLAEGAKYSCVICRYGFRSRSALAKYRAITGHQRKVAIANEFFGGTDLNSI